MSTATLNPPAMLTTGGREAIRLAEEIVAAAPATIRPNAEGIEPFTPLHMKEWVRTCPLIPADQTCGQVSELFRQRRDLECIVIADERQKPRGLVMKHRFFRSLSSRFGIALYEDKPIALLMDAEPLIVDQDVLPQELIDKAMSRSEEKLYDTVIVTSGNRLEGILTISDLLNVSRLLQREAAERQIRTVRGAESMIVHVHEAVGKVADAVNDSRASSERIAEIAGYGQQALAEMLVLFRLWHDTASLQEERMSELQQHTNEAVGITRIIFELADRCNLLAVNAQIEAARAGEHGKGFAVVAEEVRALADQTKQQADRINRQLTGMNRAVEQAAGAVKEGKQGADQGVRGVGNAEKTFSRLWEISSDNLDAAAKLTDASGEAAAVSDQIRAQIAKLASQLSGSIR